MSNKRVGAVVVAATMKRLQRFTAKELNAALGLELDNTRRWMSKFSEHELIRPNGYGTRANSGNLPIAWEWRG